MGSLAFLIETHTEFGPSYASAIEEAERVWPGIIWNLQLKTPLSGHITDEITGEPIEASISFEGISFQHGETNHSNKHFGYYHQFCPSGTYQFRFAAEGYAPVVKTINILADSAQVLDVKLKPSVAGIEDHDFNKTQIDFMPNFPNPCNNGTTLSYTLKDAGSVLIEIYNVNGTLITTLMNDFQSPGSYQLYWNLEDNSGHKVSDGLYVSRLSYTSPNATIQKLGKIIVQKK
jgi:hypothetical protein